MRRGGGLEVKALAHASRYTIWKTPPCHKSPHRGIDTDPPALDQRRPCLFYSTAIGAHAPFPRP
ncbi:hypothetical protein L211DRAFT_832751 [Terfezia boudieri ATCC MYA-4762]|uniref:Uncharacterized protein n=1 Tax=Terfezia boudieri ATCC MYA-4762 TaxID=1051890 RepID=A0A3N4M131_9PEZI|nr:hypothetical protein L211DRAFT_832751 [Terfezia boudieri ATCC MYA-4762]